MYKVLVEVAASDIDGKGVFTKELVSKGTIAWIFTEGHDIRITREAHDALDQAYKDKLGRIGYLSPWTGLWVYPPDDDPAQYTNHSDDNNLSVVFDEAISPEPYFVANRDIAKGEELTNNYHEFDTITRETKPTWAT